MAALYLGFVPFSSPAWAGTPFVDGISDQSLPAWDGGFSSSYFAHLFASDWVANGRIKLARYVVQWDMLSEPSGGPNAAGDYRERFEAWYEDASRALGLSLDLSLVNYRGAPPSANAYGAQLEQLLDRFAAIRYLEAWNEPNHSPGVTPGRAADYTNIAASLCAAHGCTPIAGNLLDSPGMVAYERAYERGLDPVAPTDWGVHPYYAVNAESETTVIDFREALPRRGAGARIWFTEVGAYRCEDFNGALEERGEAQQARDAWWLVNRLMPMVGPVHVFYYEVMFKEHQPPPCTPSQPADAALYVPGGAPGAPDRPRAAAAFILGGEGLLWGNIGLATNAGAGFG